jgi:hypothetical protein
LADRQIQQVALTGLDAGFEFFARLDGVAPHLDFCSDGGSGCLMPWRVQVCGCDAYAYELRRFGPRLRPTRRCTKPTYCPLPSEVSARLMSRSVAGDYLPTTLSLKAHTPEFDQAGALVADTINTISNLAVSQLAVDSWQVDYPKRIYVDTRDQVVTGSIESVEVDHNGVRQKYNKLSFDSSGVTAWDRQFTVKRHDIRIFGVTIGRYYSVETQGGMNCIGEFHLDTGGEYPSLIEDALSYFMCGG